MNVFSVKLPLKLYKELEVMCKELERSKVYIVRKALEHYLEKKRRETK